LPTLQSQTLFAGNIKGLAAGELESRHFQNDPSWMREDGGIFLKSKWFVNWITEHILTKNIFNVNLTFLRQKEPLVQWFFQSSTETGPKGQTSGLSALLILIY
jgi:hypothetical protein